jgi:hypothetical protein
MVKNKKAYVMMGTSLAVFSKLIYIRKISFAKDDVT